MALTLIDPNLNIRPPVHPAQVTQSINGDTYTIGVDSSGTSQVFRIYSNAGGSWSEEFSFTTIDSGSSDPSLIQLDGNLILVFQDKYIHSSSTTTSRWYMQYLTIDINAWTYTVHDISTEVFSMLPSEGPMIFDAKYNSDKIVMCFNYADSVIPGSGVEKVARAVITTTGVSLLHIYNHTNTIEHLYVDYHTEQDKFYLVVKFDQLFLYEIFPRVKLTSNMFNLEEVQYVSRLAQTLGFSVHLGFTKTTPKYFTIHKTYFSKVPDDSNSYTFHFYDVNLVVLYRTGTTINVLLFNLDTKEFKTGNVLENTHSYNVAKDDGVEKTFTVTPMYVELDTGYYEFTFDALLDAVILKSPAEGAYASEGTVEHIFVSSVEEAGNNLNFSILLNRDSSSYEFDSEQVLPGVTWSYEKDGVWEPLLTTGLPPAYQGHDVKVEISKEVYL